MLVISSGFFTKNTQSRDTVTRFALSTRYRPKRNTRKPTSNSSHTNITMNKLKHTKCTARKEI